MGPKLFIRVEGAVTPPMKIAAAGLLAILWSGIAAASTPEYSVKAAYLYNFAKFTEWPAGPSGSLTICVYGRDPFGGFLEDTVRGKQAHGVPIHIKRLPKGDEPVDGCQILFISTKSRMEPVLNRLQSRSILTVGESDGFFECGGMIRLVMEGGTVRFDLNLAAIAAARLQVSSRLVEIGRVVGPRK